MSVTGDELDNYTVNYGTGTFVISKAALDVTIDANQGKTYGDAEPTLKASIDESDLRNGDTAEAILGLLNLKVSSEGKP